VPMAGRALQTSLLVPVSRDLVALGVTEDKSKCTFQSS
jgi:hypothetical protein